VEYHDPSSLCFLQSLGWQVDTTMPNFSHLDGVLQFFSFFAGAGLELWSFQSQPPM
jgi:hypothetical protein